MKKSILIACLLLCQFSVKAFAVGQGVYVKINAYFENASVRQDAIQCVDLKGQSVAVNKRFYAESESGVFSGCLTKPSFVTFSIYQNETKVQTYTLNISAKKNGSSIVLDQDFASALGLQGESILYGHFGNGSQDHVNIAIGPIADHWQQTAGDLIANKQINQVLMPGSHDSGTYGIDDQSFITPDAPSEYIDLVSIYAKGWSKTQEADVSAQLSKGIRYFDLRICGADYKGNPTAIVTCHGFSGEPLDSVLNQISAFLSQPQHSKEIVILDINHVYSVSDNQLDDLNKRIKEVFQDKLASPSQFKPTSLYSAFWSAGKQVIVSIDSSSSKLDKNVFWPQSTISSPWPNAQTAGDVINAMKSNLRARGPNPNTFFVLQSQKTPNADNMIKGKIIATYPRNIKEFTGEDKNDILNWLQSNKDLLNGSGNIIIEDFSNGIDLLQLRTETKKY